MSDKLDKSRSYGEVYGDPKVRYEQDGKQFNGRGELVQPDSKKISQGK